MILQTQRLVSESLLAALKESVAFTIHYQPYARIIDVIFLAGFSWMGSIFGVYGSQLWAEKKGSRGEFLAAPHDESAGFVGSLATENTSWVENLTGIKSRGGRDEKP